MKRIFTILLASLALACPTFAYDREIRSIDITVTLTANGDAHIIETWDVTVADGTEWYLVKDGLDGSTIGNLSVSEEGGSKFINEGEWDVDRSMKAKQGRCGTVSKHNGCELCWGVGNYGPHKFIVSYTLSGAVRALDDYDYFHWQLVTPGLSARPQKVRVTMQSANAQLDTTNTRAWGFGYEGPVTFENGKIVYESSSKFSEYSSVIALLRFDKELFETAFEESGTFEDRLDRALEGASFDDDIEEDEMSLAAKIFQCIYVFIFLYLTIFLPLRIALRSSGKFVTKRDKKKMLGCWPSEVQWWRDLPYDGNLASTEYTMKRLGEIKGDNNMAAALILRMIYGGQLNVTKDEKGKIEIHFADSAKLDSLTQEAQELFAMMQEASGADGILQDKEFSKWSSRTSNQARIRKWATGFENRGKSGLISAGELNGSKFTESGRENARKCFGFKKFLEDFTLIKDKTTIEVHMWQEYLVFASLFGMAEKVAKELKDIDTSVAEQVLVTGDRTSMYEVILMTNSMSRAITNARYVSSNTGSFSGSSRGGFGGGASFGGGGGFHGGGFGGGSR